MNPEEEKTGEAAPVEAAPPEATTVAEAAPAEAPPSDPAAAALPAEAPPEAPAEPAAPKHSEAFRSRIKKNHPDLKDEDEEGFYEKANEELDDLEAYRNNNQEANKALMEIFDAEPEIAEVLKDMVKGASLREALSRHFSPDELTPKEGDPDEEGWKKNSEARNSKRAEREKYEKEKGENDEFSMKSIQEFAKENNLSNEDASGFLNQVGEALDEIYKGKISKSFLNSMFKALNHEKDVKTAETVGEIKGKNEKIDIKKESEKKPKGDGLPVMKGGEKESTAPGPKKNWVTDLIDKEKNKDAFKN
jgi:hypothetical protein